MVDEKKRIFVLMFILAGACLTVAGMTIAMLYRTALEEQREVLVAMAQSHAFLIEAMADFQSRNKPEYPGGLEEAILSQVVEAHNKYEGIGATGELTLAKREGDKIVFLLSHRYYDFDTPEPVPMSSELAEPMRRALSGLSGTVIGFDYRGETVLAAYEPVAGTGYGVVAKVDLNEMRIPFFSTGITVSIITVTVVLSGCLLFLWITGPILERIRKHSQRLETLVVSLQKNEKKLQSAYEEMELRVTERTMELASANEDLLVESRQRARAEERLRALWKIARLANSEEGELHEAILSGALKVTQSAYACLGFLSSDGEGVENIIRSAEVSEDHRMLEGFSERSLAKEGIWEEAVRRREGILINDYPKEYPEERELDKGAFPMKRVLVLPIYGNGRVAALLAAVDKESPYTEEDVQQLGAFINGVQVILEQREAKARLSESEKKYSDLVENSLTGIFISAKGKVLFANDRFAEMHGYTIGEVMGMESQSFVHPEDRSYSRKMPKEQHSRKGMSREYTLRRVRKNGEILWTTNSNSRIRYQGEPAVVWNVNDITARVELEEALRQSEKECHVLSQQVFKMMENERKRLAYEIHDGINQLLAALKFRIEGYLIQTERTTGDTPGELLSIVEMIQRIMKEVERIQNDLRPVGLDELGILATAADFCEEFRKTYPKLKIDRLFEISEPDIPDELKAPLFRILQESMYNSAKHSRASRIEVRLQKIGSVIEMAVEDNGVGFRCNHRNNPGKGATGLGLYSMKERTELSGGSLEVRSSPEAGTIIRAFWLL